MGNQISIIKIFNPTILFFHALFVCTASIAATYQTPSKPFLNNIESVFKPKSNDNYKTVQFNQLSHFEFDPNSQQSLPVVGSSAMSYANNNVQSVTWGQQINLYDAIVYAIQRHPEIAQSIATLASQNSYIDVAKAQYYPQLSGGISTGSLGTSQSGLQLLELSLTQMVYDFGKVKSSVDIQKAKLMVDQAEVLVSIDDIAQQVGSDVVNIERYKRLIQIERQQIDGIQKILDIANLRAKAGISSQADPIQALSYLQSAQSSLVAQQSLLNQYQEHLRTLIGVNVANKDWIIPDDLVKASDLYHDPEFNTIPKMISALASVEVAKFQKKQTDLSRYPTLSLKGSVSQAINGTNPNNYKDNGLYSSIMLEASSNFYQGGAIAAQSKAASYAEQAARSNVNAVYLDVLSTLRTTRESIENKQKQIQILSQRRAVTVKTRELYQDQYTLGTRSLLDLLNAEMAIHSADSELENARFDIYNSLVQYIQASGRSRQAYQLNNISIQGFEVQP